MAAPVKSVPLRLRIRCVRPPDPQLHRAAFGLQEKKPGDWVIHEGVRERNGDICFECECAVCLGAAAKVPDFSGRFIHGKPGERFLYLSWKPDGWSAGESEPGPPACVRRIKIHLRTLNTKLIEKARRGGGVLQAVIQGTAKDGGPACASVPLLGGDWECPASDSTGGRAR